MANRILKPKTPYAQPAGFEAGAVPFSPSPFLPDDPQSEIVDKDVQFVHPCTKSTFNKPTAFKEPDACGNEYYIKGNIASSINQLVECGIVSIFQGSLSLTVAADVTKDEYDAFTNSLSEALWDKIQGLPLIP